MKTIKEELDEESDDDVVFSNQGPIDMNDDNLDWNENVEQSNGDDGPSKILPPETTKNRMAAVDDECPMSFESLQVASSIDEYRVSDDEDQAMPSIRKSKRRKESILKVLKISTGGDDQSHVSTPRRTNSLATPQHSLTKKMSKTSLDERRESSTKQRSPETA